jgi:hypothetical protein
VLNTLVNALPADRRLVTCEEVFELRGNVLTLYRATSSSSSEGSQPGSSGSVTPQVCRKRSPGNAGSCAVENLGSRGLRRAPALQTR